MEKDTTENKFKSVIDMMIRGLQVENENNHREKVNEIIAQYGLKLLDPETFHLYIHHPNETFYDVLLQTLLRMEKSENNFTYSDETAYKIEIYYKYYDLIDKHLDHIFESTEGLFASSDKSRFILNHYIAELKHGTTKSWSPQAHYQVPRYGKKEDWTRFIESFCAFVDGQPNEYIRAHNLLMDTIDTQTKLKAIALDGAYIKHPTFDHDKRQDNGHVYVFKEQSENITYTLKLILDRKNEVRYNLQKEENGQKTRITAHKPKWVEDLLKIN